MSWNIIRIQRDARTRTHTPTRRTHKRTHTHARTVCRCVYAPWRRVRAVTAFRKIRTTAYTYFPVAHRATPRNTQHSLPRILDQVGHTTPGSFERGGLTLLARESSALAHGFFRGHSDSLFRSGRSFQHSFFQHCCCLLLFAFFTPTDFPPGTAKIFPLILLGSPFFFELFFAFSHGHCFRGFFLREVPPTQQSFPGYPLQLVRPTAGRPQVLIAKSCVRNPSFP